MAVDHGEVHLAIVIFLSSVSGVSCCSSLMSALCSCLIVVDVAASWPLVVAFSTGSEVSEVMINSRVL